jgi:hypothetical protein
MARGQERRRKQLADDPKKKSVHYKLKEEALDRTILRTRCVRGKELIRKLVN